MSNYSKYKVGDRVSTIKGGGEYNVTQVCGKTVKIMSDSGVIELTYQEDELKFFHKDIESIKRVDNKHVGEICPKCKTPWKKTTFGTSTWYDCIKCGKKAEDLLTYSSSPTSSMKLSSDDILKQFEQMLDDDYDDDGSWW